MAALLMAACKENNLSDGYKITGKWEGSDSTMIYLRHVINDSVIMDSTKAKNGLFEFTGKLDEPTMFYLQTKESIERRDRLAFLVENAEITISVKSDSLAFAIVKGSKSNDELQKYYEQKKPINEKIDRLYEEYARSTEEQKEDPTYVEKLDTRHEELDSLLREVGKEFAIKNPKSYVSLIALRDYAGYEDMNVEKVEAVYNVLEDKIKNSVSGKEFANRISVAKKTAVGQPAINFTQQDVNGKLVSLSSFKGKYVLVDFWASWCGPCRAENPNVVKAFNKYKSKGFDILGVSFDDDKDAWLAAIKKDGLTWTHVSDLKGWENAVAKMYQIKSIPQNYLLDKEGKIIGKNLRGEDLELKLAELIK